APLPPRLLAVRRDRRPQPADRSLFRSDVRLRAPEPGGPRPRRRPPERDPHQRRPLRQDPGLLGGLRRLHGRLCPPRMAGVPRSGTPGARRSARPLSPPPVLDRDHVPGGARLRHGQPVPGPLSRPLRRHRPGHAGGAVLGGSLKRAILPVLLFVAAVTVYVANGRLVETGDSRPARYLPWSLLRELDFDLD